MAFKIVSTRNKITWLFFGDWDYKISSRFPNVGSFGSPDLEKFKIRVIQNIFFLLFFFLFLFANPLFISRCSKMWTRLTIFLGFCF